MRAVAAAAAFDRFVPESSEDKRCNHGKISLSDSLWWPACREGFFFLSSTGAAGYHCKASVFCFLELQFVYTPVRTSAVCGFSK